MRAVTEEARPVPADEEIGVVDRMVADTAVVSWSRARLLASDASQGGGSTSNIGESS